VKEDKMICEVCHQKHADIVFKTVTGDQVATKAMCLACAHSMQQDMVKMFMALGFRRDQVEEPRIQEEPAPAMPRYLCTQCGRPYEGLDEHTMAGCAACYDAMREELDAVFGSKPQDSALATEEAPVEAVPQEDALSQLHYRMMEAVIKERFEEAARLRDQINRLELAEGQT